MIPTTELKKGLKIELEGKPFVITQSAHTNPGKGSAFVKCKLKNLENGSVIERTFKSGVDTGIEAPDLDEKEVEYLYSDMEGFHFMCQSTFETINLREEQVGDSKFFLQEGIKLNLLFYKGRPISLDLPNFVVLRITETDPGLKGDTASGGLKKAILETGFQVNVPLFIKENELIRVDTRDGEYVERVKG
jgi:elongation factor P